MEPFYTDVAYFLSHAISEFVERLLFWWFSIHNFFSFFHTDSFTSVKRSTSIRVEGSSYLAASID